MKALSNLTLKLCAAAVGLAVLTSSADANVYATDIQVNGNLTNATATNGVPVSITYRLNQTADLGVTVNIVQGGSVVASITGGTNMGLNTVSWTPTVGGTFGINIAAAASGFPFWTQISVDTNSGMEAYSPAGIDVDKNTNSPYYGRVVMSCSQTGSGTGAQIDGLYKMNADGTQADEGWYGYAGYINDDGGDPTGVGQMPSSGGYNPMCIRIGDDDRIYWCDNSAYGAILSCDMLASTNNGYLIVIDEGTYSDPFVGVSGHLGGPHNYRNCPEIGDLDNGGGYGIQQFDVTATTTSNAAVWLVDFADSPNWGVWMFHMTNGQSDPADQKGTQAVATGGALTTTSSGIMVDSNLDVFISQNIGIPGATNQRCLDFKSWNGGVPPPEGGGYNYALSNGPPTWQSGGGTSNLLGIRDTVLDSRAHPKYVALPLSTNNSAFAGVCVLSASNGLVVSVTNGATIQTLTNIDMANKYVGAGWDNVGNLYGVSSTAQLWRVWSPPGAGTNTTLAIVQVVVPGPPVITGITASPTTPGCAVVTITFTAPGNMPASQFQVVGSSAVNGTYAPVGGVTITGGAGSYQATFTNCSTEFFAIAETP